MVCPRKRRCVKALTKSWKKELIIMASEKTMKFIEDIKALSVLELAELVEAIQEEFGVTAAVAAAPAAGGREGKRTFPVCGSHSGYPQGDR